jgi:aminoglycoside 6'-N-acetyltransferase
VNHYNIFVSVSLRKATFHDSSVLKAWDLDDAVGASGGADDNYDWDFELPRLTSWREFLIAEVNAEPIGMVVLIDTLREERHYWADEAPTDSWAIDIWIGNEENRSRGFGTKMMRQALARCFNEHRASCVLVDPLETNVRAIAFYRRLGFREVGPRRFGEDQCLVMSMQPV